MTKDQPTQGEITTFLCGGRVQGADRAARVFDALYDELRRMAGQMFRHEPAGHSLQPTALINEVWLKMNGQLDEVSDRDHFFALAARGMRQVLIDHARAKGQIKRGGGRQKLTLCEGTMSAASWDVDLLEFRDSLDRLAKEHERASRVVELRVFAALPLSTVASLLDVSEPTVKRDWQFARLWLMRDLDGQ
ncbi:MAG: sigma-70 family RNA polymerase sigma factor [Phycisphaeraceae bacterium]|nr:sigma-70 family RNA polymerase sigma factor [Phycisphaerales bacterium]MCB9843611.1 sigma-70 family RNA polymerase sigma factor [Phycisphaeraceae bacterium]